MEFKEKLKHLRLEKGLSQEALAKELMTSRSTVAKWESGIRIPTSESLKLIALVFEIEVSDLFDNQETTELAIKTNDKLTDLKIGIISISSVIFTCIISILYFFKLYGTYCIDIIGMLEDKGYIYITYSLSEMEGNPFWIISLGINFIFIAFSVMLYIFRNKTYFKNIKLIYLGLLILMIVLSVVTFLSGRFMLSNWLDEYLLLEV